MDIAGVITVVCTVGVPAVMTLVGAAYGAWMKIEGRRKDLEKEMKAEFEKCNAEISAEKEKCEKDRNDLNARFIAIETRVNGDVPTWVMSQDGVIVSASSEFVRIFCAPRGLRSTTVVNKKLTDLVEFSRELVDGLENMEREVLIRKYSHRSNVDVGYGVLATIIMTTLSSSTGDPVFVAYAVPE